jgi:hypothetical protein
MVTLSWHFYKEYEPEEQRKFAFEVPWSMDGKDLQYMNEKLDRDLYNVFRDEEDEDGY